MTESVLRSFSKDFPRTAREKWICVYPIYIDSLKSASKGRKIPKEFAVENPKRNEIQMVLQDAGLENFMEQKIHPKELDCWEPNSRTRFRVKLFDDDGKPLKSEFPNRMSLLKHLGSTIPKLKVRIAGPQASAESSKTNKKDTKRGKKR